VRALKIVCSGISCFRQKNKKKKQKRGERESEIDHDAATAHSRGYFLNRKGLPFLLLHLQCRLQSYFETILFERIPLANIKICPISKQLLSDFIFLILV